MSEPVNEDQVQRLDHFNPARVDAFLPEGAALLSDQGKERYDALMKSDLPPKTAAAWLRNTLRGEGKQDQLDELLRRHHPEVGDQLSGNVGKFTQDTQPVRSADGTAVSSGEKDQTGGFSQPGRDRPDLTR